MSGVTTTRADEARTEARARVRNGVLALALWALTFLVYVSTVSTDGVNTDAAANSLAAWQLANTGQPWMEGLNLDEAGRVVHFRAGRDGHIAPTGTPGPKLAAVPFYWSSSHDQRDYSTVPGSRAAAFCTSVAVALLFLALCHLLSRRLALCATLIVAFSTPLWSVSANALWTHPVTVLGLALAAWGLAQDRTWLAGVGFAVGISGRPHLAVIAAVVGLALAFLRRSPRPAITIGIISTAGAVLVTAWSDWLWDSWDPRGSYAEQSLEFGHGSFITSLPGFFVAPERGLLVWSPLLLVLALPAVRGWRTAPDWTRAMAAGGAAYALVQAYINPFGGDSFWGYRHGLEPLVCVVPLLAVTASRMGPRLRAAFPVVLGVQFAAIAMGSVFDWLSFSVVYGEEWRRNSLIVAMETHSAVRICLFVVLAVLGVAAARFGARFARTRSWPAHLGENGPELTNVS